MTEYFKESNTLIGGGVLHKNQGRVENEKRKDKWNALWLFVHPLYVEAIAILIYSVNSSTRAEFFGKASVGLILAGALILFGAILGFLFGIPRTLQVQPAKPGLSSQTASRLQDGDADGGTFNYRANTNLEEISDWLTKILVGVGLTQISEIHIQLKSLTEFAAQGLGSSSQGQVFAFALITYSTVLGFLFVYLCTRIYLPGLFSEADRSGNGSLTAQVENFFQEIGQKVMDLVARQLDTSAGEVDAKELNDAVAASSATLREQVFNKALNNVAQNFVHDRSKMARSIPIYRALIAGDAAKTAHKYHAQLAYALHKKTPPDLNTAETEYSTAIEIRNRLKEDDFLLYEFGRALVGISMPADPQRTQQIRDDLRAASRDDILKEKIAHDDLIEKWLQDNRLTAANITG